MIKRWKRAEQPKGNGQGAELRAMALQLEPSAIGLTRGAGREVWAVVMDSAMEDGAWHCLVAIADGTTSLYTSSAFGVIGAGTHPRVRSASESLLRATEAQLGLFAPTASTDLPPPEHVAIRALAFDGHRIVTAPELDLAEGRHPASTVFHRVHEVITEVRLATPG